MGVILLVQLFFTQIKFSFQRLKHYLCSSSYSLHAFFDAKESLLATGTATYHQLFTEISSYLILFTVLNVLGEVFAANLVMKCFDANEGHARAKTKTNYD